MRLQQRGVEAGTTDGAGAKLIFANQLRGLAALSVMLSHLGGVFVLMGPLVGWMISAPEVHVGEPAILRVTRLSWLNEGAFGVAVFFLISGFVIPFSLRAQDRTAFLIARGFRIYPLLWAALLLEWLAVFAQHRLYGRAMAFPAATYLSNALLLDTVFGGYVDLVNWTLAIEVKFYLLMALMRPWILAGRVLPLFAWALFGLAVAAAQRYGLIHLNDQLADEPMLIGFMLIGTLFHYHLVGRLGAAASLGAGSVLFGLFVCCWRLSPMRALFPSLTMNYLYALVLFLASYLARGRFRSVGWLDRLADISFPLYLIHSIIGYSVMTFSIVRLGCGYAAALAIALAVVLPLAWLLHRLVEVPSLRLGKRLARSWRAGGAASLSRRDARAG